MSHQFAAEESFPLHILRTNSPRFKIGGGHAVEISKPNAANTCKARLVLKTAGGRKEYIHQNSFGRMFRSDGPVEDTSDKTGGETYKMNWQRLPMLLNITAVLSIVIVILLLLKTTQIGFLRSLIGFILGSMTVILCGFSRYVRTVFEFADDETYIVCYMPERCYYRLPSI